MYSVYYVHIFMRISYIFQYLYFLHVLQMSLPIFFPEGNFEILENYSA